MRQRSGVERNSEMIVKSFVLTISCLIGMLLMIQPLLFGQGVRPVAVMDAVQNQRLKVLEANESTTTEKLGVLESKMNLILGGVSGIYAVFGMIGINNILGALSKSKGKA